MPQLRGLPPGEVRHLGRAQRGRAGVRAPSPDAPGQRRLIRPAAGAGQPAPRSRPSSSRTSASVSWPNDPYHSPTARNASGSASATTESASRTMAAADDGAATGTASTVRPADLLRSERRAARAVTPVARPSSTTMTVRPATSGGGRPPRYTLTLRSSSARSRATTGPRSARLSPSLRRNSSSYTGSPPSAMAPTPSSGWYGYPIFLVTSTSSGAASVSATSRATATPPRGRASTSGPAP